MSQAIVVLNAGSSSIKFSLYAIAGEDLHLDVRGQIEGLHTAPRFKALDPNGQIIKEKTWPEGHDFSHKEALQQLAGFITTELQDYTLAGVGHRVVHGGLAFDRPVCITAELVNELEAFVPLAPLHQPHNLAPIRILLENMPDTPQVACFDTSFHRSNPAESQLFAIPLKYAEEGVRRYGFHGLSYEYISSVLGEYDPQAAGGRTVVLHLGNGVSMCALREGKSVASTMGFTAVDGLMMGTRCGSIDPGVILYLMDQRGMDARAIETLIYKESGLLGVSGICSDMRTLLESSDDRAKLAVDLFVYRIKRELGSLAAALGGLDALVFTAGIGENAVPIRKRVCRDAAWLGVELDEAANTTGGPRISAESCRVSVWVIPTNEELMIARHTLGVLAPI